MYLLLDSRPKPDIEKKYMEMVDRRSNNEPLQYIIGSWGFMSLDFVVNRGVLIPRQDTEAMVEHLIDVVNQKFGEKHRLGALKILDLCTGSGCVAVSLAHYLEKASVIGVDFSVAAASTAKRNAALNRVDGRVAIAECDIFSDAMLNKLADDIGAVDILCSNPPYIPTSQIKALMPEVRCHEPEIALDGGEDGLSFYRRFSDCVVPRFVRDGGFAAFEVGIGQAECVMRMFEAKLPMSRIYAVKDSSGIDRVVCVECA